MTHSIHVVVYTYKGSNLVDCINSVYDLATKDATISMVVYDQHPLNRSGKMPPKEDMFSYEHIFWDHQYTPINYKKKEALKNQADYFLSISADITMKPNWDRDLINFISGKEKAIVSGQGMGDLRLYDKYFVKNFWGSSGSFGTFSLSNYLDRNFIFSKRDTIKEIHFPIEMKYYGEEEMMSLDAFRKNIEIYSASTDFYIDNHERNIENLYCPFSREHMYNNFIDYIMNPDINDIIVVEEFFKFHNVEYKKLKRIPYQVDDVLYDPNTLKIVSIGGERFIDSVKVIY